MNRSKTIRVNDEINETQSNGRRIKIILSRFVRAFPQKEKMERMKGGRVNETKAVNYNTMSRILKTNDISSSSLSLDQLHHLNMFMWCTVSTAKHVL